MRTKWDWVGELSYFLVDKVENNINTLEILAKINGDNRRKSLEQLAKNRKDVESRDIIDEKWKLLFQRESVELMLADPLRQSQAVSCYGCFI